MPKPIGPKFSAASMQTPICVAACLLTSLMIAPAALAQTPAESNDNTTFTLGLGAVSAPAYEGADHNKTRALPLVNYRSGRFFAGMLSGVGYNFSTLPQLEFGPVLSYRLGRDESDSYRLSGLGDIEGGADMGAFVRWNLQPFALHATLKQGVSGDVKGTQLRVGLGYGLALGPSDRLAFDASVDWADSELMQTYYGVSAAQSARSGLSAYNADSGIRRYGVGAVWTHSFTQQWFSTLSAGVYRLGASAADSPITTDRNVGLLSVGLGYRF